MTEKPCCHCCKDCFSDDYSKQHPCEICERLGRICKFGHGRCKRRNTPLKKETAVFGALVRETQQLPAPPVISQASRINRIFPPRSGSFIVQDSINQRTRTPISIIKENRPPSIQFPPPVVVNHNLTRNRSSFILKPVYYDVFVKIEPQNLGSVAKMAESRGVNEDRGLVSMYNEESLRTKKSNSTFANTKRNEGELDRTKLKRQPLHPSELMRIFSQHK